MSLAFVIDFGRIYVEKRIVQNAADAAVAAVAQHCAKGDPECSGSTETLAAQNAYNASVVYSNGNSPDNATRVVAICGRTPFQPCDSTTPTESGLPGVTNTCRAVPVPEKNSYIRVTTATRTASQGTALAPVFAPLITGSNVPTEVYGCAQIAISTIGGIAKASTPIVIGICSYEKRKTDFVVEFANNVSNQPCTIDTVDGKKLNYRSVTGLSFVDGVWSGTGTSVNPEIGCTYGTAVELRTHGDLTKAPDKKAVLNRQPSIPGVCSASESLQTFLNSNIGKVIYIPLVKDVRCDVTNWNIAAGVAQNCQGTYWYTIASFAGFKLTAYSLQGGAGSGGTLPVGLSWPTGNGSKLYGKFVSIVAKDPGFTEVYDDTPWTGVANLNRLP